MNNFKKMRSIQSLVAIMAIVMVIGCSNDDYLNDSVETFLPKFELMGDTDVMLECNSSGFSDPGVVVTEGGSPISFGQSLTSYYFGASDVSGPDYYEIGYSAVNVDSIPGSAFRNIFVPPCNGDLVSDISGTYLSATTRISGEAYSGLDYVLIKKISDNEYAISHAIGAFYDKGREYGYPYAAIGAVITANNIASNDFSITGANIPGFGLDIAISDLSVDAGAKTITYHGSGDFGSGDFDVVLTQVDP